MMFKIILGIAATAFAAQLSQANSFRVNSGSTASYFSNKASKEYGLSDAQRVVLFNFLIPLLSPGTFDHIVKHNCMPMKKSKTYSNTLAAFSNEVSFTHERNEFINGLLSDRTLLNESVKHPVLSDVLDLSEKVWTQLKQSANGEFSEIARLYFGISIGKIKAPRNLVTNINQLKQDVIQVLSTADLRTLSIRTDLNPLMNQILIEVISSSVYSYLVCDPREVKTRHGTYEFSNSWQMFEDANNLETSTFMRLMSGEFSDDRTPKALKKVAQRRRLYVNAMSLYMSSLPITPPTPIQPTPQNVEVELQWPNSLPGESIESYVNRLFVIRQSGQSLGRMLDILIIPQNNTVEFKQATVAIINEFQLWPKISMAAQATRTPIVERNERPHAAPRFHQNYVGLFPAAWSEWYINVLVLAPQLDYEGSEFLQQNTQLLRGLDPRYNQDVNSIERMFGETAANDRRVLWIYRNLAPTF